MRKCPACSSVYDYDFRPHEANGRWRYSCNQCDFWCYKEELGTLRAVLS